MLCYTRYYLHANPSRRKIYMSHVFISYSRTDSEYVERLVKKLQAEGFDVWYDRRTDYGDEWWEEIVKAIEGCAAFIVVMTPESGKSRWVKREVMRGDKLGKPQFAVLLDGDFDSSRLWAMFDHTQPIDVRDKSLPPPRFFGALSKYTARSERDQIGRQSSVKDNSGKVGITHPTSLVIPEVPRFELPSPPDLSSTLPPPFEWCYIPAGKVTIEYGEPQRKNDKFKYQVKSREEFDVSALYIAKYPITNNQFQEFVAAKDGYRDIRWWDYSAGAKAWRLRNGKGNVQKSTCSDCPQADVAWYEAIAFCNWLNLRARAGVSQVPFHPITLPTEQQWQRAAQGDDGRIYPWGNEADTTRSNTSETQIGRTSPVTQYPTGASPFGVLDMAGNIWEWCLTSWDDGSNQVSGGARRCLRGGAWFNSLITASTTFRHREVPDSRRDGVGFRIAW